MSIKLNRREFLQIVFATTSLAVVAGSTSMLLTNELSRPVMKPAHLVVDEYGYLVDPDFDYDYGYPPTNREYHSLSGLGSNELKIALEKEAWLIEQIVADPNKWSLEEISGWLDEYVELSDMGAWEGMKYTRHGPALDIYQRMDRRDADEIGFELVEGDHPGSSFVGVAFRGDFLEVNRQLKKKEMNLVVTSMYGEI